MAKNGQEVVYEGWLTKSPPSRRIFWRAARWRRRWFSLTHSGEIPNQFILTYYADRNCRKVKGFINLDDCEQVDLGLKLDVRKLKFDHVFDIKTPYRTYYLAADTESEMKSWVTCICKVCGLKATSDEEDLHMGDNGDVTYQEEEEKEERDVPNSIETPPISPVSTSPYIPISECITGRTPILNDEDMRALLQENRKNSVFKNKMNEIHSNQTYVALQYVNDCQDPRFYDCPRALWPNNERDWILQSFTETESVCCDDMAELDLYAAQKFTKVKKPQETPPPRPPKSAHANYMNLGSNPPTPNKSESEQKVIGMTDDMYDFPRSHNVEVDPVRRLLQGRHCYDNAAPGKVEGQVFRYDISPKPSTSQIFRYDLEDLQDEPASPLSQSSSTTGYSNLPSPLLPDGQLMPPPAVNRGLKPKRKLSDSLSSEPASPRGAPSVDRKLKPTTPLLEGHTRNSSYENAHKVIASPTLSLTRKTLSIDEDSRRRSNRSPIRAAPSPKPPSIARSYESLLWQNNEEEQIYHHLPTTMEYLDLDFVPTHDSTFSSNTAPRNTVYKKVDFEKTEAFNITRHNLEKERKETVTFLKK